MDQVPGSQKYGMIAILAGRNRISPGRGPQKRMPSGWRRAAMVLTRPDSHLKTNNVLCALCLVPGIERRETPMATQHSHTRCSSPEQDSRKRYVVWPSTDRQDPSATDRPPTAADDPNLLPLHFFHIMMMLCVRRLHRPSHHDGTPLFVTPGRSCLQ